MLLTMNTPVKKDIATLIRQVRAAKGITQQELADLTGISLRSVQRIEHAEVVPRAYTIRALAEKLGINNDLMEENLPVMAVTHEPVMPQQSLPETLMPVQPAPPTFNMVRKIILSAGSALLMVLGTLAFIFQSPRFPETAFEALLLWLPIAAVYFFILYKVWK